MVIVILIILAWLIFAGIYKVVGAAMRAEKIAEQERIAEDIDLGLLLEMRYAFDRNNMEDVEEIKQRRIANKHSKAAKAYIHNETKDK